MRSARTLGPAGSRRPHAGPVRAAPGVLGLLVVLTAGAVPAVAQEGGAPRCAGEPVTIYWQDLPRGTLLISGTNGRDVIQGGPTGETIQGRGGDDVVCAGGGNDVLDGGLGRDELLGQDGSDRFVGAGLGEDLVTGGSQDYDSADYGDSPVGVRVDASTRLVVVDGSAVAGGVQGLEEVIGSDQDDHLIGTSRRERLLGLLGNDVIEGRGGADEYFGSGGSDTVSFERAGSAVQVNLGNGEAHLAGVSLSVQSFEVVVGTRFNDRLTGRDTQDGNDHLIGLGGDDVLKGKGGDDVLEGRGGDDTIFPGPGDDFVDGGTNDPVTSSGEHGDLVSYQGDTVPDGQWFDAWLATTPFGTPPGSVGIGEDSFVGLESIRIPKTARSPIITGTDGPNVIIGGDRGDQLKGEGGNDLIYGLAGNDVLVGNAGDDYLDAAGPTGAHDSDSVDGGDGDDTCTGADSPDYQLDCETIF